MRYKIKFINYKYYNNSTAKYYDNSSVKYYRN